MSCSTPFSFLFFGRCLIHSSKAEETLQNLFTAWIWAVESPAVLLLQTIPAGSFGNLGSRDQTSTELTELFPTWSFHLDDDCCVCPQPVRRRRHSTLNFRWNSAGQKCPEMVDEDEQCCGLCCWACSEVLLLELMICQEFNCNSYRHIHLSFSTAIAGRQWGHGNLKCRGYAVIFYLNLMNLLTQSHCVQIKATRQRSVCWKFSLTIAVYL